MKYAHVSRAVFGQPWAILPEMLATIVALVEMRASGERLTTEEIRERLDIAAAAAGPRMGARGAGTIGVIPIYGVLMARASMMSEMSGGTSVAAITKALRMALDDPEVTCILLEVDSPGGEVGGIEELAAEIRAARGRKPIVAIANTLMASAAYWIASAADEIVAAPSAMVGSIGVYLAHVDHSSAEEMDGVRTTLISAGTYKVEGNPHEPLDEQGRAALQQLVDDYYGAFVGAVAKGRGVTAAAVRSGYGEGRVLTARRAVEAGLADRVDTLDGTLRRMTAGRITTRGTAAAGGYRLTSSSISLDGTLTDAGVARFGPEDDHLLDDADLEPDRTTEAAAAVALARARQRR